MKRLGAVLLSAAMVLSLTACGGGVKTDAPAASEPAKESASPEAAPAEGAAAEGTDISGSTLEAVSYTHQMCIRDRTTALRSWRRHS